MCMLVHSDCIEMLKCFASSLENIKHVLIWSFIVCDAVEQPKKCVFYCVL